MDIYKHVVKLMGCRFELCLAGNDMQQMQKCIQYVNKELSSLEKLLSTYEEKSETNLINKNAGICPVEVDPKVFELIEYSISISELSKGAFDITYGSCNKQFWNFDLNMTSLPEKDDSLIIENCINYKNIILDKEHHTVLLKEKNTRIGFGGIAKGLAADFGMELFKQEGFHNGYINASGDIRTWGHDSEKNNWTVGIKDPFKHEEIILDIEVCDGAVATSGNYERSVNINGEQFSHTIDTATGYPLQGLNSITIVAPNATYADALATAVGVLDIENGLKLINQLDDVECFLIDKYKQYHASANFRTDVCFHNTKSNFQNYK